MNVLSLFDGMSCGQIALKEQGISVKNYYASEIDKYAIKVTQHNFPDTIQLGCVTKINISELKFIDLLIAGSPCTDLSIAGSMKGMSTTENKNITTLEQYLKFKNKGVKFHGQSYLFWEYVRVLRDIQKYNPNILFLLENVPMKKKWERLISETLVLFPVSLNSALVSAQNRNRLYWTNIRTKKVGLFGEIHSDIPQPEDKGLVLKDILEENTDEKYYLSEKMINCLDNRKNISKGYEFKPTTGNKKAFCIVPKEGQYSTNNFIVTKEHRIRRLTPLEAKRAQTVPDWYDMSVVSETQQYKMLGNGWTVDVIKHIFSFINIKNKNHEKNKLKS